MSEYQNFVFYGSMRESIDALPEELGNKLLRAIMNYGTDGEIDRSDAIIYSLMCSIMPNINKAKERYTAAVENGKKGGRPQKVNREQVKQLLNEGKTVTEIAKECGCSTSTIYEIKKGFPETQKPKTYLDIDKDIDIDKDNDTDKEKDTDNEREIYTDIEKENNRERDTLSSPQMVNFVELEKPKPIHKSVWDRV